MTDAADHTPASSGHLPEATLSALPPVPDKDRWPELVGEPQDMAVAVIKKDRPDVHAELLPEGSAVIMNYCPTRVWVFLDNEGRVARMPVLG